MLAAAVCPVTGGEAGLSPGAPVATGPASRRQRSVGMGGQWPWGTFQRLVSCHLIRSSPWGHPGRVIHSSVHNELWKRKLNTVLMSFGVSTRTEQFFSVCRLFHKEF